jgi:hypothetical protein
MIGRLQHGSVPDYTAPIIGFRTWRLRDYELYPAYLGKRTAWVPGVNVAECGKNLTSACSQAPQPECSCGLYARFSFDEYQEPIISSGKPRRYTSTQKEMVRRRYGQCSSLEEKQQLATDAGIDGVRHLFNLAAHLSNLQADPHIAIEGAVVMWGRIEIHESGMRAEYARVVALVRRGSDNLPPGLVAAARYYRVPLVADEKLVEVALEHGRLWRP